MKTKKMICLLLTLLLTLAAAGCGAAPDSGSAAPENDPPADSQPAGQETDAGSAGQDGGSEVASASQMAPVEDVVDADMVPIPGSALKDGVYDVTVDSSSSMFNVTACELTVERGEMNAVLHMGGTGYLKVFMGTGEEAAQAAENDAIPFVEESDGTHSFTVPVEALDQGIACAAFSKNKELWYDRTLVFRADSLPQDAFQDGAFATAESLGLENGSYTVEVKLEGGSGKAKVESPAALRVEDGAAYATLVWSSPNYDYMRVEEEKFLPLNTEGNATFEIPVAAFDRALTVYADTTAMSTPHEIEYTVCFNSAAIEKAS